MPRSRAFGLMIAATAIDALDGPLARHARVQEVLPGFDGRRLDDLIDFLNYTCLPLLLIWRAGLLSGAQSWWLLAPLLASAYGFSQADAKTEDGYFLGFPSYWNVVAFYIFFEVGRMVELGNSCDARDLNFRAASIFLSDAAGIMGTGWRA